MKLLAKNPVRPRKNTAEGGNSAAPERPAGAPARRSLGAGGKRRRSVPFNVGSSKVQNFPPDRTFAFWERDCLAALPLGMSASRKAGRGRIPWRIKRKGNGIMDV